MPLDIEVVARDIVDAAIKVHKTFGPGRKPSRRGINPPAKGTKPAKAV